MDHKEFGEKLAQLGFTEKKMYNRDSSFEKDNLHIWGCIHKGYPHIAVAMLENGRYTGHKYFEQKEDVISYIEQM